MYDVTVRNGYGERHEIVLGVSKAQRSPIVKGKKLCLVLVALSFVLCCSCAMQEKGQCLPEKRRLQGDIAVIDQGIEKPGTYFIEIKLTESVVGNASSQRISFFPRMLTVPEQWASVHIGKDVPDSRIRLTVRLGDENITIDGGMGNFCKIKIRLQEKRKVHVSGVIAVCNRSDQFAQIYPVNLICNLNEKQMFLSEEIISAPAEK